MTSEERMREALRTIRDIVDTCHSNTFGADLSVIHGIAIDALHSVEAEKEPAAYMDSWEYEEFKSRGSGTVVSDPKHMGKAIPFYLNPPEHKPE